VFRPGEWAEALAKRNNRRLRRILREIDAPRNQAIAEGRMSARVFIDGLSKGSDHD